MDKNIAKIIKKSELHLHLDGSMRIETMKKMLEEIGINIETSELKDKLMIDNDIEKRSLVDYLEKFNLPLLVLQKKENLSQAAFELLEDLNKENYEYAEIRFAPHLHLKEMTLNEVVESVLLGCEKAKKLYGIEYGVILCIMRHLEMERGYDIVNLAEEYKTKGVVGIDLAGDEKNHSVLKFQDVFRTAVEKQVNITIHAGEAAGAESIKNAIKCGAKRIGHGIRAVDDIELMKELAEKQIVLEMCPISNLQTGAVENISRYPILKLMEYGIPVTVNTDNRTVSNTNLEKEFGLLQKYLKLNEEQVNLILKNNLKYRFY